MTACFGDKSVVGEFYRGICGICENGIGVILKEPCSDNCMNVTADCFYDKCRDDYYYRYGKLYDCQKLGTDERIFFVLQENPPCIKDMQRGMKKSRIPVFSVKTSVLNGFKDVILMNDI